MRAHERAAQIWSLLALSAKNRQTLTYELISKLIGVPGVGLGQLLEPIQSYCLLNELPPLTILVVQSDSGMPGSGFIAASDIPRIQQRVVAFDWIQHGAPSPEALQSAAQARPSNGIASARLQGA